MKLPSAVASIGTAGPHGLPKILYASTSATGTNGSAFGELSGGSNLGTTSVKLKERVGADIARLRAAGVTGKVPADGCTASDRAATRTSRLNSRGPRLRASPGRALPEQDVAALVEKAIDGRLFGFIGEPRVNVLKLNLALSAPGNR